MIISCHIPKTAGTTFCKLLTARYRDCLVLDYGDRVGWTGPQAEAWRSSRPLPDGIQADNVKIVHGHFYLSKYLHIFPDAHVVAFVRNPVDRVISNYRYLACHAELNHPLVAEFHRRSPTLLEWAEWSWARDLQSKILKGCSIEAMALLGITERFHESLERFDAVFRSNLAELDIGERHNHSTGSKDVSDDVRTTIAALNPADSLLYQQALVHFESMVQR